MLFQSKHFLIFFVLVFLLFVFFRNRNKKVVPYLLLSASYYFYAQWNASFLILILLSTFFDYVLGWKIYKSESTRSKKLFLVASLFLNLSLLGYFKYYNFITSAINVAFTNLGISFIFPSVEITLPVGISFYTFQTLSYSIDIYRGCLKPHKSIVGFATYVAFFPQLVAGPILRAKDFFPYLKSLDLSRHELYFGLGLFSVGVFKKVVIADLLAMTYVDSVFSHLADYSLIDVILATVGYSFQIYNDFSGYTDMAIGLALMLGFQFPDNFNYPYLASNIREFWNRWHISLSTWLRDYLYISLGGSRGGELIKYRNIFITMVLGGLWHGANWNFVIWGAYHGVIVCISHMILLHIRFPSIKNKILVKSSSFFNILATYTLVCFGWFLFRVSDLGDIHLVVKKMMDFSLSNNLGVSVYNDHFWWILILAITQHVLGVFSFKDRVLKKFVNMPFVIKSIVLILTALIALVVNVEGVKPFIYFQF